MKIFRVFLWAVLSLAALGAISIAGLYLYIEPQLPSVDTLRDVRFQVPMRIYTADEQLVAEFGEKRRVPVAIDEVPQPLIQAFLAAEDDRYFEHPGVDYQGLLRAAFELIRTGEKRQGGSTITMQVARNFFLSAEKSYLRKITEIFLSLKIEKELTKNQILELYLNRIFLGHRAYGVGAAAQVYYGNTLENLRLDQIAVIAGLPKAPSRDNPVSNPERARERRDYVLRRMYHLDFIDAAQYKAAVTAPIDASLHSASVEVEASYAAEMARAELYERFGDAAYTEGYQVHLTIDSRHQAAANRALRNALHEYDQRHGYRGPVAQWDLAALNEAERLDKLQRVARVADLQPALVTGLQEKSATALLVDGRTIELPLASMEWAQRFISENRRGAVPKSVDAVVAEGDVVYLSFNAEDQTWRLSQLPAIQGALIALNPENGATQAVVGGYAFQHSKFNRAVQAERQPGSGFKPIIYSAALENGFTPASIINDAPVVFDDPGLERAWRPENYSGRFYGPTRLREALTHSRNLVSIRLLQAIGVRTAVDYAELFGFSRQQLPRDLSLALGSASATPLQMARAYSVFANGGYLVDPYLIARIHDSQGELIFEANPQTVCRECEQLNDVEAAIVEPVVNAPDSESGEALVQVEPAVASRVIEARNAWLMQSLMKDVVKLGTGRKALQLGRGDIAGKTGTTNDQRDAWFSGFSPALVTIAWVGFDNLAPLGNGETGGRAALPMWIDYMREALNGVPEIEREPPEGLVTVKIDPDTGLLASSNLPSAIFETFRVEDVPQASSASTASPGRGAGAPDNAVIELF